jgi:mRNA-degrading endonuclease RelE of RelBE toxin-antitoxin system
MSRKVTFCRGKYKFTVQELIKKVSPILLALPMNFLLANLQDVGKEIYQEDIIGIWHGKSDKASTIVGLIVIIFWVGLVLLILFLLNRCWNSKCMKSVRECCGSMEEKSRRSRKRMNKKTAESLENNEKMKKFIIASSRRARRCNRIKSGFYRIIMLMYGWIAALAAIGVVFAFYALIIIESFSGNLEMGAIFLSVDFPIKVPKMNLPIVYMNLAFQSINKLRIVLTITMIFLERSLKMDKALRGVINGDSDSESDEDEDEEEGLKGDIDNLKDDIDEFVEEDENNEKGSSNISPRRRRRESMNPLHQIYVLKDVAPIGKADPKFQKLFNALDLDNSKSIELDELKRFVNSVKKENKYSDLRLELIFHSMDVNGDEKLSYEEFVLLCQLMQISPDSDASAFVIQADTFNKSISGLKQDLPPNWVMHIDPKTGKEYYHNVKSKETTWTKPKNDMFINKVELSERLKYLDLFERLDTDRSNSVDINEFRSFIEKTQGSNSTALKQLEDMLQTNSGKYRELILEEFVTICNNLGINPDGTQVTSNQSQTMIQQQVKQVTPQPQTQQEVMMNIRIPVGAIAGTTLQVQAPDGRSIQVIVPSGMQPGQTMQIQVPSNQYLV